MNISRMRATFAVISALAMLSLAVPSSAQQKMAPAVSAVQGAPAATQSPAAPPPAAAQAPAPSAAAAPVASSVTPDAAAAPADGDSKLLKPASPPVLRELSPWSMFLSADIIVKAVMIGLAFASLVTWTIFIAKMIELTFVQRKLRGALAKIGDARSLAEAQFALGAKAGRAGVLAGGCDARGAVVGGHFQRRRHQGTRRLELRRDRARRSAPDPARHGPARHHRRDLALRRPVRHRLGHHEQLHRHLEVADHQPRRGRARHRRGAARDRDRPRRGDPGRDHLQSLRAGDQGLSRTGQPCLGRRGAAVVARPRPHPWSARTRARRRSRRWASRSQIPISTTTAISRKRTRSTSRRSSTSFWCC